VTRASPPRSIGPILAPGLSVIGLIIVALITFNLLNGNVPFAGGPAGADGGDGGGIGDGGDPGIVTETPAPSNVVIVPDDVVTIPGSIVYAKAGNIWVQSGKSAHQVTTGGADSMPSWAPDGTSIIFIRTTDDVGRWPSGGVVREYQMSVPSVMQVASDGSGNPRKVVNGKVNIGGQTWHAWIREPVLSPDGHTLAMVSDRPNPSRSNVVLQFYDMDSGKSKVPDLPETPPLGHQDPSWRPDGKFLLYVRNGRNGTKGAPIIYRWDVAKAQAKAFTTPGYLEPAYSPDGRFVAATKTSSFGNDIVILDATTGRELMRVTDDGASWAPVWSPLGDSIAFLHLRGQIVDLKLAQLEGQAPDWLVKDIIDLTEVSGLDGESRPGWFVSADDLPSPTPTATPPAVPLPSASVAAP
jgi:Tol biopolymer transport system component